MIKNNLNFNQGSFLLFDSKSMPKHLDTPLAHFALTDALISYSGRNNQSIIHFWQTSPLVILGMMDTKIGHFEKALDKTLNMIISSGTQVAWLLSVTLEF